MGAMPPYVGALDAQLTRTHDVYAWHRDVVPCALGRNNDGHNALAHCCGALA